MIAATVNETKHTDDVLNDGTTNNADSEIVESIVALATPIGFGGVAIVRVSGTKQVILNVINRILRVNLKPRYCHYGNFYEVDNDSIIDRGIALYFNAPHSYTGEYVFELHCHGGPVVVDRIITEVLKLNVRLAEPGEFTKRAWMNGKMDLAQVEAVSDLINATSVTAAKSAANTLVGDFSRIINTFLYELIHLRTYVEAAIDFSEEYIDFIQDGDVVNKLNILKKNVAEIIAQTKQGVIIQEGINIVISGEPNVGKSSLLNALCRREEAIVTDIPGTTRDIIKTNLNINGIPINLVDTAGLRHTEDLVEQEGIKRAYNNIEQSDLILLVIDASTDNDFKMMTEPGSSWDIKSIIKKNLIENLELNDLNLNMANVEHKIIVVFNKIDKLNADSHYEKLKPLNNVVLISAKNKEGIHDIEEMILQKVGFTQTNEGQFIARRRHLECLKNVENALQNAEELLMMGNTQELIAEELTTAQRYLNEITGEYTSDDLLGSIFSSFCIGK